MNILTDWDGTIRQGFTIIDWVSFLESQLLTQDQRIYTESLNIAFEEFHLKNISHDDLSQKTSLLYGNLLKGFEKVTIETLARDFIKNDKQRLMPFSKKLFKYFKVNRLNVIVISGSPVEIIKEYDKVFHFEKYYALELEIIEEKYTGLIKSNVGLSLIKNQIARQFNVNVSPLFALGNSTSDIPILEISKFPIGIEFSEQIDNIIDKKIIHLNRQNAYETIVRIFENFRN